MGEHHILNAIWKVNHTILPSILSKYQQILQPYVHVKHFLITPILLLTIICLIITIIVLTRNGFWGSAAQCIIVLAVVDLLAMCFLCVLMLDYLFLPFIGHQIYVDFETIMGEIVDTLLFMSNWLTVLMAVDRYQSIGSPHSNWRLNGSKGRCIITTLLTMCIFVKIPGLVFNKFSTEINTAVRYRLVYVWIVQVILFLIIPSVILSLINIRLIIVVRSNCDRFTRSGFKRVEHSRMNASTRSIKIQYKNVDEVENLREHSTKRNDELKTVSSMYTMSQSFGTDRKYLLGSNRPFSLEVDPYAEKAAKEERKLTITLICLIIIFSVFQGPCVLFAVLTRFSIMSAENEYGGFFASYNHSYADQDNLIPRVPPRMYMNPISVMAYALKSDLYFIFYCWFCSKFWRTFKSLFCCKNQCDRFVHHSPWYLRRRQKRTVSMRRQNLYVHELIGPGCISAAEPYVIPKLQATPRARKLNIFSRKNQSECSNDGPSMSLPPNCYQSQRRIVVDRNNQLKVKLLNPLH